MGIHIYINIHTWKHHRIQLSCRVKRHVHVPPLSRSFCIAQTSPSISISSCMGYFYLCSCPRSCSYSAAATVIIIRRFNMCKPIHGCIYENVYIYLHSCLQYLHLCEIIRITFFATFKSIKQKRSRKGLSFIKST